MSLNSFKILGGSWAVAERIRRESPADPQAPLSFKAVKELVGAIRPVLCTASDGNHGRAIAALADWLDLDSHIVMARGAAAARVAAVAQHGSRVELVDLSYNETTDLARGRSELLGFWYCPDTAAIDAGSDELAFARDVSDGYSTIWQELDEDLGRAPEVLLVQAGVGALAASAVSAFGGDSVRIATVEPSGSACVLASLRNGKPTTVSGFGHHDGRAAMPVGVRNSLAGAARRPDLCAGNRRRDCSGSR